MSTYVITLALLVAWFPIRGLRWVRSNRPSPDAGKASAEGAGWTSSPGLHSSGSARARVSSRLDAGGRKTNDDLTRRRRGDYADLSAALTAAIAAAAVLVFLRAILPGSWLRDLMLCLLWGLLTLALDRRVVTATFTKKNSKKYFIGFLLAVGVAAAISAPTTVTLLRPEIDEQLVSLEQAKRDAAIKEVGESAAVIQRRATTQSAIDEAEANERAKNDARVAAQAAYDDEISGRGGSRKPGCGPVCRQKGQALSVAKDEAAAAAAAAAEARANAQAEKDALELEITRAGEGVSVTGADRREAVLKTTTAYPMFWLRWVALTGFLFLGDLVPMLRAQRNRRSAGIAKVSPKGEPAPETDNSTGPRAPRRSVPDRGPQRRILSCWRPRFRPEFWSKQGIASS